MDAALLTTLTTLGATTITATGLVAVALVNKGGKDRQEATAERLSFWKEKVTECEEEKGELEARVIKAETERDAFKALVAEQQSEIVRLTARRTQ